MTQKTARNTLPIESTNVGDKTLQIIVEYPEHKFPDDMWGMFVTYGPLDGTGSLFDADWNLKIGNMAQKIPRKHNQWGVTFSGLDFPDQATIAFNVHALNFVVVSADPTAPPYISPDVSPRGSCMVDIDSSQCLNAGLVYHNETVKFVNGLATVHLYPSFCFAKSDLVEIGEIGNPSLGFLPRMISAIIPGSMVENTIKRNYSIFYALDGMPYVLDQFRESVGGAMASAQATDIIIVGIPPMIRDAEYIPFPNVFSADDWLAECGGPCTNPYTGLGAVMHKFIRESIEPAILNALSNRVSGINRRGILGYSYGGLLTFYEAMYHPDQFDLYGAMSPSLGVGLNTSLSLWPFAQLPPMPADNRIFVGCTIPNDRGIIDATNMVTDAAKRYGVLVPGVNYFREDLYFGEHCTSSAISMGLQTFRTLLKAADYI